jgi:hypothetical protein
MGGYRATETPSVGKCRDDDLTRLTGGDAAASGLDLASALSSHTQDIQQAERLGSTGFLAKAPSLGAN